jgi:penicillin-binding protein 2
VLIRSAPGTAPVAPHLRRRVRAIAAVIVIVLLVLVGRLWQLQIVRGEEYFQRALNNVVHERRIPSVRGKILDRRGIALADNRPAFNLYAHPGQFQEAEKARLAAVLGLTDEERALVRQRLEAARARGARQPVLLLEDQGRDRASLVAQTRLELRGVEVRDEPYRTYPHGELAAHLLGYMNQLTPEEASNLASRDYAASEMIGRYGLERQWESYLRGKKGVERVVVDATGRRVDSPEAMALIEGPRILPPVAGHNLVLTLDHALQEATERAAAEHASAAIAVVEVHTGRLLAVVSTPSFDPNVMTGHLTREDEQRLLSDPRRPFVDKTLRQHYPAASTFKVFTALASLESGDASSETKLFCGGYHRLGNRRFHCMSSHGHIDLREALMRSCNVYFWELAERIGMDRLSQLALDFGFGAPTGLGLNGDVPGRIPSREYYERERGFFTPGYTLNAAVGQGDVAVTVIQMAMAYAALANGGELYVPQVVERVETASGEVIAEFGPRLRRRVDVGERALATVREGLIMAVQEPGGTGYRGARSELVELAGKTGTAQVRSSRQQPDDELGWHPERNHSWFVGFAPARAPEIAFAVLIPHGGHGSRAAAPVGRQIVEAYFGEPTPAEAVAHPAAPEEHARALIERREEPR